MKKLVILAALLVASVAQAERYRCVVNGTPTYSDVPCAVDAEPKGAQTAAEMRREIEEQYRQQREADEAKKRIQEQHDQEEAKRQKAKDQAKADCQSWLRQSPVVVNRGGDGSVSQVERHLMGALKDPDSLVVEQWGKVERTCDGYGVIVKYRAKNSFGGYVRETKVYFLDRQGRVTSVI
jgi:hypothetical protein